MPNSNYHIGRGVERPSGRFIDDVTFLAGDVGNSDHLWVRAFDGDHWSDWKEFWVQA